jgi:RimJ/RimL family protein N-acetyltransferase
VSPAAGWDAHFEVAVPWPATLVEYLKGKPLNVDSQFELQPTLVGPCLTLRPLRAEDFQPLYAAAADPLIWEQHPEPTRYQRQVFEHGFFAGALASGGAFVVIDNSSGSVIGSTRYYEWDPAKSEVAIGFTFLARSHWGGDANREMKRLMLDHAFRWARVVWFHVGLNNWRSRKALEKIGGRLSHEETKTIQGGVERTRAYYRIDAPR